jgi:hypothetical protein
MAPPGQSIGIERPNKGHMKPIGHRRHVPERPLCGWNVPGLQRVILWSILVPFGADGKSSKLACKGPGRPTAMFSSFLFPRIVTTLVASWSCPSLSEMVSDLSKELVTDLPNESKFVPRAKTNNPA